MKAGVASENGIEVRDMPQPRPKPNEVLVKVRAASLNRADLTTARGLPHGSHGGVGAPVGIEWAGEVVEAGAEVEAASSPATASCAPAPAAMPNTPSATGGASIAIPDGMSFEQAATLPVALITLHNALVTAGRLRAGRERDDPGRQLGRRPDGLADRQAHGREAGDRLRRPTPSAARG